MRKKFSNIVINKHEQFQDPIHLRSTTHHICHSIHSSFTTDNHFKRWHQCGIDVRTTRNSTCRSISVSQKTSNKLNPYHTLLRYRLAAGTNNTHNHFTAIIRTTNNRYVRFNDLHPQGCFPLDALIYVDFALYALDV